MHGIPAKGDLTPTQLRPDNSCTEEEASSVPRHLGHEPSPPTSDKQLAERVTAPAAEPQKLPALKHDKFGKMSEDTRHWLTHQHPAFAPLKHKPKNTAAILGSQQLSEATNIWVVTEKIHGSNFSFVCFPPTELGAQPIIHCAKREEFLDENSDSDNASFFGFRKVKMRYQAAAEQAYTTIEEQFANKDARNNPAGHVVRLTIYGELFGGKFPGLSSPPDVHTAVQEGVYYHPDLQYMAFGVTVMLQPPRCQNGEQAEVTRIDMDFLPAMETLQQCGFFTATALHVGSFTECCNYDINFTSTIPDRLGVAPQASREIANKNMAEGIVCRTNIAQTVLIAGKKTKDRCMFKRKRDAFASYCAANTQSTDSAQNRTLVSAGKKPFLQFVENMVKSSLIDDALSKTGHPNTKDPKKNNRLRQRTIDLILEDIKDRLQTMMFSSPVTASGKKPAKAAHKGAKQPASVCGNQLLTQYDDDVKQIVANAVQARGR